VTNATYAQPSHVRTYVMSETHSWFGRVAMNVRLTRSGGLGAVGSGIVVRRLAPRISLLAHPQPQSLAVDPEVLSDVGDRPAGLAHQAHRPLTQLVRALLRCSHSSPAPFDQEIISLVSGPPGNPGVQHFLVIRSALNRFFRASERVPE